MRKLAGVSHKRSQIPVEDIIEPGSAKAGQQHRRLENERNQFQARKHVYEKNIIEVQERKKRILEASTATQRTGGTRTRSGSSGRQTRQVLDTQHRLRADLTAEGRQPAAAAVTAG